MDDVPEETNWLKRAGRAKITYPNGDYFQGQINQDKQKHGHGKYVWVETVEDEVKEIASYDGEYVNSKKEGLGKMIFPNGDSYHGMWKNDVMEGDGTFMYANGDIFSGNFVNGIKQGQGTYEFKADKSQLVGEWKTGTIVTGTWRFADGGSYAGEFEDGKPIGTGAFKFSNGFHQEGEYAKLEAEDTGPARQWTGGSIVKIPVA